MACLAVHDAAGNERPRCLSHLLATLGAGTPEHVELEHWMIPGRERNGLAMPSRTAGARRSAHAAAAGADERRLADAAVRTVVVGPERFNADLAALGVKSAVHFGAFARLLSPIWELAADGVVTFVRGDKHGGRHFYLQPLSELFPETWIDRGPEGAELSRYTIRSQSRKLVLSLGAEGRPERWAGRVGIDRQQDRPRALDGCLQCLLVRPSTRAAAHGGLSTGRHRFRAAIEAACAADGHDPVRWWRIK